MLFLPIVTRTVSGTHSMHTQVIPDYVDAIIDCINYITAYVISVKHASITILLFKCVRSYYYFIT